MIPIACTLDGDSRPERVRRWVALRSAVDAVATTARGVRVDYRHEPGVEAELRELAALEADCCAFAAWHVEASDGRVRLEVTARGEEAVPAAHGLLHLLGG